MMLWYKAWRESRTRFLISALFLVGFCLFVVLFQERLRLHPGLPAFRSHTYSEHVYQFIYSGTAKGIFLVLILPFLGLGGLRREQARGTAGFTLALPAGRLRLSAVQAAVGVLEMAALALLPACLIPLASRLVGQSYPFSEAARFSLLWFGCGTIVLAMAFFYSVVFAGEYTAPAACVATLLGLDSVVKLLPYHLKLGWLAAGYGIRGPGAALAGSGPAGAALDPIPWAKLLGICAAALLLFAVSAGITQRQDY